ncbi:hypothetical protein BSG1_05435 [Bacillus sp. SG-1]|nr:hypothetical protein BSG1_05435 [Bacillus sp. SG-1]
MLFNNRKKSSFLNMFGRRKRMNRRMLWSSVLSLGMSAAAYALNRRNSNTGTGSSIQGLMKNRNMNTLQTAMAEFANEIAPNSKLK